MADRSDAEYLTAASIYCRRIVVCRQYSSDKYFSARGIIVAGNAARGNQAVDPLIYEHSPLRFPGETSSPAIKYLDGRICTLVEERETPLSFGAVLCAFFLLLYQGLLPD